MSDQTAGLHQAGSNISGLKDAIAAGYQKIKQQKLERTLCNEQIATIRADLKAKGVSPKAFDMAMKVADMDPVDREGFDIAYDICREAVGHPVQAQGNLFTDTKEGREAVAKRRESPQEPVDFGGEPDHAGNMGEAEVKQIADEMDKSEVVNFGEAAAK